MEMVTLMVEAAQMLQVFFRCCEASVFLNPQLMTLACTHQQQASQVKSNIASGREHLI
jgi:hypothetical protein